MTGSKDLTQMTFTSRAEWEGWLATNHGSSPGVWLKFAKKGSSARTVTRADALEVALCWGWIDSQAASLDDDFWLQRFTPRTKRSRWSRINREAAESLITAGRMQPPGLAEVERARADGRWDRAYASPKTMTVPPDFQARLDDTPAAREFFASLNAANRYAILFRIEDAKRPETRARRIESFITMLVERKTLH